MRRETLHLTLAFVGDVSTERLEMLKALAASIRLAAFDLLFDRQQCLSRKKIYWVEASLVPPGLRALAAALSERLKAADFRSEERPFAAHVTLLRHTRCEKMPPAQSLHIDWPVQDFVLVESELRPEGARYGIIGRWGLDQT